MVDEPQKKSVKRSSAQKRQIQSEKRRVANKAVRSRVKTKVKQIRATIIQRTQSSSDLQEVYSLLDKASKKGVVSKNKARRLKSRLARQSAANV